MTLSHLEWKDCGCKNLEISGSINSTVISCVAICFNWKRTLLCHGHGGAHRDPFFRLIPTSSNFWKWQPQPSLQVASGLQETTLSRFSVPFQGHVPFQWLPIIWTQKLHTLPSFEITLMDIPTPSLMIGGGASIKIPQWNNYFFCPILPSHFLTSVPPKVTAQ